MQPKASVTFYKATPCPSCRDYIYRLPFPIDQTLADFLSPLGSVVYPLDKFKIFLIRNDVVVIDSMIGRQELRIRFLKDATAMSALFKDCLSRWIAHHGATAEYSAS
jgi:hypothetical protein